MRKKTSNASECRDAALACQQEFYSRVVTHAVRAAARQRRVVSIHKPPTVSEVRGCRIAAMMPRAHPMMGLQRAMERCATAVWPPVA
jgi:hypothetical protein